MQHYDRTGILNLHAFGNFGIGYRRVITNIKRFIWKDLNQEPIPLDQFINELTTRYLDNRLSEYEIISYMGICRVGIIPLFDEVLEIKGQEYINIFNNSLLKGEKNG